MSTSRPSSPPHHVSRAQDPAHAEHESRVPTPHRTALASAVFSPVPFLGGPSGKVSSHALCGAWLQPAGLPEGLLLLSHGLALQARGPWLLLPDGVRGK